MKALVPGAMVDSDIAGSTAEYLCGVEDVEEK
jgi:hypothetical protein